MTDNDNRLGCVIADDEPHIRARIAKLAHSGGLHIVGMAADGLEAERLINAACPDIAFIDIRMPGINGLELAGRLADMKTPPAVVFVTALGEHALAAFALSAIDYVVKPLVPVRFAQAVERAKSVAIGQQARDTLSRLNDAISARPPDKLTFRSGSKLISAKRSEVVHLRSVDDYVEAYLTTGTYLLSVTMNALEQALTRDSFMRVHRSHMVNMDHVRSLEVEGAGRLVLTMAGGAKIPVSRGRAAETRKVFKSRLA